MSLFQKHQLLIENSVRALKERNFFAAFPEHPKAYGEEAFPKGKAAYDAQLGKNFEGLFSEGAADWIGEEESPYTRQTLGVKYPSFDIDRLINNSKLAATAWRNASAEERAGILVESLDRVKDRFFEMAFATQHTTGQSFMMSFQASGPHGNDRAMESIALGYESLKEIPQKVDWEKPMGKVSVKLAKRFNAVPKGTALVIGCSTFPTWNSVPGLYASLITGNPTIVKPHPKAVYPIAIVVAELQAVLVEQGLPATIVQLAPDLQENLIAKDLAEHPDLAIIDYTGGSAFGNYIESIPNKTVFTEKAGINSVILDSADDLPAVFQNLAFSVSLYSGQMCTAPQNFFIPETGVKDGDSNLAYEDVVAGIRNSIIQLSQHPKMGPGVLGAVQNDLTLSRAQGIEGLGGTLVLKAEEIKNGEFESARTCAPAILEVDASETTLFDQELFGPIILIIKTKDREHSLQLAKEMGKTHGAITCSTYTTDQEFKEKVIAEMESVFVPVTFNLIGNFVFVNQHAAFSDFHVTGGNPAGNASFTNEQFVNRRFVWVGHREMSN